MFPASSNVGVQWHNNSQYLVTRPITIPLEVHYKEYHHYYGTYPHHYHGTYPRLWSNNPFLNYQHMYANTAVVAPAPRVPVAPSQPPPPRIHPQSGVWPEGFTLRGELRWGRLEKVYGPRRELPEFVNEDLRRVYGTYPRTDLSITYRAGEYTVRGDPHVGEQEYKVERRVVRQEESSEEEDVSEAMDKKKKKKKIKMKR